MLERILLTLSAAFALVATTLGAVWTFASTTENVSLIGGGGILAGSIGLLTYIIRLWAKENGRLRAALISEGDRADRAEWQRAILRELVENNGIAIPANYHVWPVVPAAAVKE